MEALLQVLGLPVPLPVTCAPSNSEVALAALSSRSLCSLPRHHPATEMGFLQPMGVSPSPVVPGPLLAKQWDRQEQGRGVACSMAVVAARGPWPQLCREGEERSVGVIQSPEYGGPRVWVGQEGGGDRHLTVAGGLRRGSPGGWAS